VVWEDTFDTGTQPNSANWNYHVGNGYNPGLPGFQGWGNGEWQWYRPENCYLSGGNLVIRADYSTGSPYYTTGGNWYQTSGRITTQGKKAWMYGKIEARIKLPVAQGNWCAFWMMGDSSTGATWTSSYNPAASYYDNTVNNWPSNGEIDICEHFAGGSTTGINNCFWDLRNGLYPWTSGQIANYGNTAVNYGDVSQFHVYAIEWDATYIKWFVDGVQTHIIDISAANAPNLEEFRKPFYIIINMAIGGSLGGAVDQASFPLYMYVDYVRVSQK
jgi:beta-glucanase (GH16 family)